MLSKFGTGAMQVLRFTFFKWNKASQSKVLAVRKKRVEEIQHESRAIRRQKSMEVYEKQEEIELAEEVVTLPLKQFSVRVHHLLVGKQKSPVFWSKVEQSFVQRFKPTTNPVIIRSHAKIIYSLSKSKLSTGNYQTQVSLVLPFASPQSFTTMVTALSRIAPWSTEFAYIVEKLYYKRRSEFRPREMVSINYSLSHNGRPCDDKLVDCIESLNCVETITMLRCYDQSQKLTPELLKKIFRKLRSIQIEFNVLDLSDFMHIYLKHKYEDEIFDKFLSEAYSTLKRNIDDICMQKIWKYVPERLNQGGLRIDLVEQMVGTIQILRKSHNMSEVIWARMMPSFKDVQNLEIRLKLEKIY